MDYAKDFPSRDDMIWKALTSYHVKNPTAYRLKNEKIYGSIFSGAVALAYELLPKECLAVCQIKIDEALSEKYGWMTREEWKNIPYSDLT